MPNLLSSTTLNILTAVGIVAAGLGYAADRFFTGRKQHHSEVDDAQEKLIKTLTDQLQAQQQINDSLTGQIHELQTQLTALTAEVNRLKGVDEANGKKIQEYLQIITNRNPDLDKTLATIAGLVAEVVPFMKEMKESHQYLREKLDALQPTHRTVRRTVSEVRDAA